MTWIFEKFIGDGAIYALCPDCGFHHMVGSILDMDDGIKQYRYCPLRGKFLFDSRKDVEAVWNERNIEELWEQDGKNV